MHTGCHRRSAPRRRSGPSRRRAWVWLRARATPPAAPATRLCDAPEFDESNDGGPDYAALQMQHALDAEMSAAAKMSAADELFQQKMLDDARDATRAARAAAAAAARAANGDDSEVRGAFLDGTEPNPPLFDNASWGTNARRLAVFATTAWQADRLETAQKYLYGAARREPSARDISRARRQRPTLGQRNPSSIPGAVSMRSLYSHTTPAALLRLLPQTLATVRLHAREKRRAPRRPRLRIHSRSDEKKASGSLNHPSFFACERSSARALSRAQCADLTAARA